MNNFCFTQRTSAGGAGPSNGGVLAGLFKGLSNFSLEADHGCIVLGAGPAGIKAAIECASMGVKVTLIDPSAAVAGLPTGAYSKCLREAGIEGARDWGGVSEVLTRALAVATAKTGRELKMFHVKILQGTASLNSKNSVLFTPSVDDLDEDFTCSQASAKMAATASQTKRNGRTSVLGLPFVDRKSRAQQKDGKLLPSFVAQKSMAAFAEDEEEEEVVVDGSRTIQFTTLIIATGSRGSHPDNIDFSAPGVYDSDSIKECHRIPRRLVVQGAGIIGLEYALIFKQLGCQSVIVTLRGDRVVPTLDPALQEACKQALMDAGIELGYHTAIKSVEGGQNGSLESPKVKVTFAKGNSVDCDAFLSSTGREGNTSDLNLEAFPEIKRNKNGYINVDSNGFTGIAGIYAVGDVTGAGLATTGQIQAQQAVWHRYALASERSDTTVLPKAVWSLPEFAWVGMTEQEAASSGSKYGTVTVEFKQTMRGCITNESGFLKLIYMQDGGRVLGVHMFGEAAADHINFGADLVQDKTTVYKLQQFIFPAVTYHELYHQAAVEASLRMRHGGAQDLSAAAAWSRVNMAIQHTASVQGTTEEKVLSDAFRAFDMDGSGFVSQSELQETLKSLGLEIDSGTVANMVTEAMHGQQGIIDYESFLKICQMQDVGNLSLSGDAMY